MRWRGGTPPQPPKWHYSKDDLRAFSKFERRVQLWRLQVKPYMSDAEAALALYVSLGGEAEEELEHLDINKIYAKDGVDHLMNQLREPLEAKKIYLKRKFLSEYESIARYAGEGMRVYVNRYHRTEKALLSIGIDVSLTYDSESRGSRLLDRAKLSLEQQRMILVGTGQSLNFQDIKNALVLQYPDHKPAPYIQGQATHQSSQSSSARHGKGKDGKGKAYAGPSTVPLASTYASNASRTYRKAYIAEGNEGIQESNNEESLLEAIPEDDDGIQQLEDELGDHAEDEEEMIPDCGDDEMEALMEVLTVTSKKLQALTQGRKYRGAPSRSIEQRKKTSTCAACGQPGHWKGDAECAVSGATTTTKFGKGGKGSQVSASGNGDRKGSGSSAQKVFSVRHAGGHEVLYSFDSNGDSSQEQTCVASQPQMIHKTLVVFQSAEFECLANLSEMQGYCVVDTACQRSCCSRKWVNIHRELLHEFGLQDMNTSRTEAFQFGAGAPQTSKTCCYFPAAFDASYPMIALSASVLNGLSIPFLASLSVLKKLSVVLDLAKQKAYIGLLGCAVDLYMIQGHLCIKISEYPAGVRFDWDAQDHHDCEFRCSSELVMPATASAEQGQETCSPDPSDAFLASPMAASLEAFCHGASSLHGADGGHSLQGVHARHDHDTQASCDGHPQGQTKTQAAGHSAAVRLRPPEAQKTRERTRPLRHMRGLRGQVEMVRRSPWLALQSILQVAVVALTFRGDDSRWNVDGPTSGNFDAASSYIQGAAEHFTNFGSVGGGFLDTASGADHNDVQPERGRGQLHGGRIRLDGLGLDFEEDLGHKTKGMARKNIKKGTLKRMTGDIDRYTKVLESELAVYDEMAASLPRCFGADFMEVFGNSLGDYARDYNLSYVVTKDFDMDNNPELINSIFVQIKPFVFFANDFQLQSNEAKGAVYNCCKHQLDNRGIFIINFNVTDHEDHSGVIPKIMDFPGTSKVIFQNTDNGVTIEECFITNSAELLSGAYSCDYIPVILLKAIAAELQQRCPWRFAKTPHDVWYTPPVDDPEAWMSLLEDLAAKLGTQRAYYLQDKSRAMDRLRLLVPWDITRAQICSKPITRRMPTDIPYTHRGAALLLADGRLHIESEDLAEIRQPKMKFDAPVRTAIFFYGVTEDSETKITAEEIAEVKSDITFPQCPDAVPREVRSAVARLHTNAGHPRKQELVRLLAAHGSINAAVLTALDHMKCGTCERAKLPLKPRPASVPEFVGQFAEQIQADIFYIRDLAPTNHALLGVTCLATKLYQATLIESRDPQLVLNAFDRLWLRPYGYPLFMTTDPDGAFRGVFEQHMLESGVHLTVTPAEQHHQIGAIERRNAIFRSVVEKLIDENGVCTREQLDLCLSAAIWALNSSVHTRGRSSLQAVFGKLPRFPGSLLSDSAALATSDYHLLTESLRAQACQTINEMSASSTIRRALLRKTATSRAAVQDLLPGSLVAYWRWNLKARGRKRGGYILGRLVVLDDKNAWIQSGGSLVQVSHEQLRPAIGIETWTPGPQDILALKNAGKLLREGVWSDVREQGPPADEPLEPTVHDPLPVPSAEPLEQPTLYDLPPPGREQPQELPQRDVAPVPVLPDASVRGRDLPDEAFGQEAQHLDGQVQVFSPSFQQNFQNVYQYGNAAPGTRETRSRTPTRRAPSTPWLQQVSATPQALPPTPRQPSMPRQPPTPRRRASLQQQRAQTEQLPPTPHVPPLAPQALPTTPQTLPAVPGSSDPVSPEFAGPDRESVPHVEESAPFEDEVVKTSVQLSAPPEAPASQHGDAQASAGAPATMDSTAVEEPLPQIPAKRTFDALHNKYFKPTSVTSNLLTHFVLETLHEITMPSQGWDGSPEYVWGPPCCAFRCFAAKAEEAEVSSDSSNDEMEESTGLSRQEKKAINRELPWRKLMSDFPSDVISLYVQANRKEYDSWLSWGSVVPVPDKQVEEILSNVLLRKRVMPSRNAYRDKNRGAGPDIRAKCRTVIQGCHDPDLGLLDRSSPTPTRVAEYLIYEIAASGYNRRCQLNKKAWKLWSGDVSTAFLQGEPEPRAMPIYMRPPRDGIQALAKTFPHKLYKIVGNLYGLCNAPKTWIKHIVKKLCLAGFQRHRLDHTVYYKYDKSGELLVILLFHVDDFLVAFREDYQFSELSNMFTWGNTNLLDDGPFTFKGKEVNLLKSGNEFVIKVTQKAFIDELVVGKLKKGRPNGSPKLDADEV